MKRKKSVLLTALFLPTLLVLFFISGEAFAGPNQDETRQEEKMFIRVTVYPTASLSRYDYQNDIDLYELRAYVDVRAGSPAGRQLEEAIILVAGQKLEMEEGVFTARVPVKRDQLPDSFSIEINSEGFAFFSAVYPLPNWLVIERPRPAIVKAGRDLEVAWSFRSEKAPVNLRYNDFKTGSPRFNLNDLADGEALIPGKLINPDSIVRIYVMNSWMYKRFIEDRNVAMGSEVNVIPWSQVFLRTSDDQSEDNH